MRFWARLFTRIAAWCESHRVVRQHTYDALLERVARLEKEPLIQLEIRTLKARMDHLELFVGMKRQKTNEPANGPKIG